MLRRRPFLKYLAFWGAIPLATTAGLLVGCAQEPTPVPTPTPALTTEEEAFAAAQQVYRDYLKAADSSDGDADEYLTGAALEEHIQGVSYLRANGLQIAGRTRVLSFLPESARLTADVVRIEARACVDLNESKVLDANGTDVTPQDRPRYWRFDLTLVGTVPDLQISSSAGNEDAACADG